MMTPEAVAHIGQRIDGALERIRRNVFRMGMSGRWHIGKATDISNDHSLIQRHVKPLDEHEAVAYLSCLDQLIADTKEQDEKCAAHWNTNLPDSGGGYESEHARLCSLFVQFAFEPRAYERLVRQSDKPYLRWAHQLVQESSGHPAVREFEQLVRLPVRDFIELEEDIESTLEQLDAARDELVEGHYHLAVERARSTGIVDQAILDCALFGLRKAANYYDYKQGYRFATYSEHWINRAIELGKVH